MQRRHLAGRHRHRVVHGGNIYSAPERITDAVLVELRHLSPSLPRTCPCRLRSSRSSLAILPSAEIACFDTAFHRDLPRVARSCPFRAVTMRRRASVRLPWLSYTYLMQELRRTAGAEAAHAESFSPTWATAPAWPPCAAANPSTRPCLHTAAGLVMSTRSGDLDQAS